MKIVLICPANKLYMPYLDNYTYEFKKNGIEFDIINWDRFHLETNNKYTYRDRKIQNHRSFVDYYKYNLFIKRILNKNNYDKIIVFGIQLTFFLQRILIRDYKNKFIIDIRDHHRLLKAICIKKITSASYGIVLSSDGYKKWLPDSNKYIINHNFRYKKLDRMKKSKITKINTQFEVAAIGAPRDEAINMKFISTLKNDPGFLLSYHGAGGIEEKLKSYASKNNISNIVFTGRYKPEEEMKLYKKSNMINILRYNDSINNATALPNRLYYAVYHGVPLLTYEGTYISEIIKKYELGFIINDFNEIKEQIEKYHSKLINNNEKYDLRREFFLEAVISDNSFFSAKIEDFIKNK